MPARQLPDHPDLDQYRKQAKELLTQYQRGNDTALERVRANHPHPPGDRCALADAQLVIAREHGVESWPRFVKAVEAASGRLSSRTVWRTAEEAVVAGEVATLEHLLAEHAEVFKNERPVSWWHNTLTPNYEEGSAREIIRRTHDFASWDDYDAFASALNTPASSVALFESAVDAVVEGDVETLRRLLREHPDLVRQRSTRGHHAMLLHYVGANGVEGFRQHTPPNAVAILETLLAAGADVDALGDMYGNSTTLGLVATSRHPRVAGVQEALMDVLIAHGARLDHRGAPGNNQPIVNGCLSNGHPEAAAYLAARGAPLDPEAAAGVGRLDVLMQCFDDEGHLKPGIKPAEIEAALVSAATTGRHEVAAFLLDRGVPIESRAHGFTGVNIAATLGNLEAVRLFIARGAALEARNEYGGTALGGALWGALNRAPQGDYARVVETLLEAGAACDPSYAEWWSRQRAGTPESHARILALLQTRSASS